MKKQPFCSVIVLNFNGKRFLDDCFKSLRKINYPRKRYEVIMADNGSRDGSVEFVKKKFSWVKVLQLDKNYGFAEGNNRAIEKAKGDYLIFLNNDTKVDENWLTELINVANRNKKIGVCGSKVLDETLDAVVGEGRLNILSMPEIRSKHDTESECFFVSGTSLLIKRTALRKLKYCFDPSFFAYFEDVDLCWRARLLGYRVFYVPQSVVLHKGSGTTKTSKKRSIMKFYHYRNKIWTFKKNSRFPLTQIFMVPVLITTLIMISYLTITKRWEHGIRVLKYGFSKKEKTPNIDRISLKNQLKIFLK